MKDVTTTSFGLLIAFLLPGLIAFYSLSSWSAGVQNLFTSFLTSNANAGLFFLVLLVSLSFGLVVSLIRFLVFEKLLTRSALSAEDFAKLASREPGFQMVIEHHYRYHQFWGGLAISLPLFVVSWFWNLWSNLTCWQSVGVILVAAGIEILVIYGAHRAFILYVERGKAVLGG